MQGLLRIVFAFMPRHLDPFEPWCLWGAVGRSLCNWLCALKEAETLVTRRRFVFHCFHELCRYISLSFLSEMAWIALCHQTLLQFRVQSLGMLSRSHAFFAPDIHMLSASYVQEGQMSQMVETEMKVFPRVVSHEKYSKSFQIKHVNKNFVQFCASSTDTTCA